MSICPKNKSSKGRRDKRRAKLTLDFFVPERANLSLIYGMIYSIFSSRCIRRNRPCRQSRK